MGKRNSEKNKWTDGRTAEWMDGWMDGVLQGTLSVMNTGCMHLEAGRPRHFDGAFRAPKPLLVVGELLEREHVFNFDAVLVNPLRVRDRDFALHGMVREPGHLHGHGASF